MNINLNQKEKIDIILPFVDCNDINWQKLYHENLVKYNLTNSRWDDWAIGMKRFRPNGTLKYVFRGIDKYCKWINKVHLIVQSESQIPEWINREKVNIVYHQDFIPKEYLPTFNSSTIEMFLQNIEGLSENFIYGNDDMIFTSNIYPKDFFDFKFNKLVYGIYKRMQRVYIGDILRKSNNDLLCGKPQKSVFVIQHTYIPYKKSIIKNVFEKYNKEILSNISPFRNKGEHNQWLFSQYAYMNNQVRNNKLSVYSTEINPKTIDKFLNIRFERYKSICINDHSDTTDEQIQKVLNKLNKYFPNKSIYEL